MSSLPIEKPGRHGASNIVYSPNRSQICPNKERDMLIAFVVACGDVPEESMVVESPVVLISSRVDQTRNVTKNDCSVLFRASRNLDTT